MPKQTKLLSIFLVPCILLLIILFLFLFKTFPEKFTDSMKYKIPLLFMITTPSKKHLSFRSGPSKPVLCVWTAEPKETVYVEETVENGVTYKHIYNPFYNVFLKANSDGTISATAANINPSSDIETRFEFEQNSDKKTFSIKTPKNTYLKINSEGTVFSHSADTSSLSNFTLTMTKYNTETDISYYRSTYDMSSVKDKVWTNPWSPQIPNGDGWIAPSTNIDKQRLYAKLTAPKTLVRMKFQGIEGSRITKLSVFFYKDNQQVGSSLSLLLPENPTDIVSVPIPKVEIDSFIIIPLEITGNKLALKVQPVFGDIDPTPNEDFVLLADGSKNPNPLTEIAIDTSTSGMIQVKPKSMITVEKKSTTVEVTTPTTTSATGETSVKVESGDTDSEPEEVITKDENKDDSPKSPGSSPMGLIVGIVASISLFAVFALFMYFRYTMSPV